MRIFTFIMAFIVFFASVIPCADSVGAVNNNQTVEISKNHQPALPGDSDLCSPFCICTCCAGFTYSAYALNIKHVKPGMSANTPLYVAEKISSISLPIWQPPQLLG